MDRLAAWQEAHAYLRMIFPAALVLLLVVLRFGWLVSLFRWLSFSLQIRKPPEQRNNPQLASRHYTEMLRVLEKRGYRRAESQTADEFAATLARQPYLAAAVGEFTSHYARARFGGTACDALRLRLLLQQIRTSPKAS